MALIDCPCCGARISDKAVSCPKCHWNKESEGSNFENDKAVNTSEVSENFEKESLLIEKSSQGINPFLFALSCLINIILLIVIALPPETWVDCGQRYLNENGRVLRKRC